MSTLRAARDLPNCERLAPRRAARPDRRTWRGLATGALALLLPHAAAWAQTAAPAATAQEQPQDEQLIVTVRANGVERGEFTLLRKAGGDYWVLAQDLPRLKLDPLEAARRQVGGDSYYSFQALGATALEFNEAELALSVSFAVKNIEGTAIDLSNRPPPVSVTPPRTSLILSYRLATSRGNQGTPAVTTLDTDINVRVAGLLLRQSARLASGSDSLKHFTRGTTQAIWDNPKTADRVTAGDLVTSPGAYGTTITGAGLQLTKLYDMTPDVITQPTATLRSATALPAQVEVSVDGNPIYRTDVGPGPITLNNLLLYGGTRNVRVTVTDISGHKEVIDEPFLFTDSVLAKGLHEYSYFVGKRTVLDTYNEWRYLEPAWQGYHRYGLTDALTIGGGGEGNKDFTNVGGGITLRSDTLGLVSLDLLASRDHRLDTLAPGWSARYSYVVPKGSFQVGRREFGEGYRSFLTTSTLPFLRTETRVGGSLQLGKATLAADWIRSETILSTTTTSAIRLSTAIGRSTTLSAELQHNRDGEQRDWSAYVFLRTDFDNQHWVAGTARAGSSGPGFTVEAGKQLSQGEGVGYHVGVDADRTNGQDTAVAFGSANWNLRPATLEAFATAPMRGNGSQYAELAVSGAVVAVDGYWGLTRRVDDGFALARLGVPQPGVEVFLNNQLQGRTDDKGQLFIPQVWSFGRQDVSFNDKQLGMQYNIAERRITIVPAYRSGTIVDFGGKKLSAVAGIAYEVAGGRRVPVAARAWTMRGTGGELKIETGNAGDFYLEDAAPGDYRGTLEAGSRSYACRLTVPTFAEAVLELKEGIVCE